MYKGLENYSNIANVFTEAEICHIISRSDQGMTRAELSRFTGFSKSTISKHVDTLLASGYITEVYENKKTSYLTLNEDCGYVVAVDLGATSLKIAVCNIKGEPMLVDVAEDIVVNVPPTDILERVVKTANSMIEKLGLERDKIIGVGMGVPAPIEYSTGKPVCPPIMKMWDDFPVKEYLSQAFKTRAYVDNDVNIMALEERWKGDGRSDDNFLFIKLGTGIGCGIIINGNIYRGSNGCAGDVGHVSVEGFNHLCYCGNIGCLEKLAGGAAIAESARGMAQTGKSPYLSQLMNKGETITCRSVNDAINNLDEACIEYIRSVGRYIGEVVAKLVIFYNPTKVIFGGGITNFGDVLLTPVREVVFGRSTALATRNLQILKSRLGDNIGVVGAAILVREELFKPNEFSKVLEAMR